MEENMTVMKKGNKKNEKNNKSVSITKSQLLLSIIAIVIGIITLIGASYAVLRISNTSERKNVLNTGSFQIDFTTGEVITIDNMGPMSKAEGMNTKSFTFTITNNGTMDANYKVYLDENLSDNTHPISNVPSTEYLMISYRTGDSDFTEPVSIQSLYDSNTLVLNKQLASQESITYEMKIWLDEAAGNEYQNTTYSARIAVESTQINYAIVTDEIMTNSIVLTSTTGDALLDYKIYGNTETIDGSLKSVGDLVTDGAYKGKYKIGLTSSSTVNGKSLVKSADIYLDEPLRSYDDTHADYIDFDQLEVVRYTKEENNTVVLLDEATTKKIALPYVQTYTEDTTIEAKTAITPSKMEFKYFKDE